MLVIKYLFYPQPERRTKQECKDAAEAKKREIRTANYEGFMH